MEVKITANTLAALSTRLYCLTAERMPRGMPISRLTSTPSEPMSSVTGTRLAISVITLMPVLYEVPKLNLKKRL